MLSWPALHVTSPYITSLILNKARNCLVTAIAQSAHANPCLSRSLGLYPMLQQPTQSVPHVLGGLAPAHALLISITAHIACPSEAHQVTAISPLAQIHAFSQHPPAQCLAHSIISSQQPSIALHSSHQAHTQSNQH